MNIRHEILKGAASGATLDDLLNSIKLPRPKLKSNIDAAIGDGLITRHRDDVTGLPAYRLTDAGKKRLAEGPAPAAKRGKTQAAEETAGSDGSEISSDTAAVQDPATPAVVHAPVAADEIQSVMCDDTLIGRPDGTEERKCGSAMMMKEMAGLRARIAALIAERDKLLADCAELNNDLTDAKAEAAHLREQIAAEREEVIEMARQLRPSGYLVAAPKRPLRRVSKIGTARNLALAAARNGSGRGEVFSLIRIGKAVRGAEWVAEWGEA